MKKQFTIALISMSLISTACLSQEIKPSTPLMNDNCNEYAAMGAKIHPLKEGLKLFEYQNKDYVWFCLSNESKGVMVLDMYIDTPAKDEAQILHISARIGQWTDGKREEWRQVADRWWRVDGWWANASGYNGFRDAERTKLNFHRSTGREMQLSKNHFGRGEWNLNFKITGQHEITYPADVNDERQTMKIIAK